MGLVETGAAFGAIETITNNAVQGDIFSNLDIGRTALALLGLGTYAVVGIVLHSLDQREQRNQPRERQNNNLPNPPSKDAGRE